MKSYDMRELTLDDVKELIKNGDDNHNNQIRVTKNGQLYLSQDVVGAENIDGLLFRFETFDANNDYVGLNASLDDRFINRIYQALKDNWKNPKSTYVDDWNYEK